jgi:hypothetical protein
VPFRLGKPSAFVAASVGKAQKAQKAQKVPKVQKVAIGVIFVRPNLAQRMGASLSPCYSPCYFGWILG